MKDAITMMFKDFCANPVSFGLLDDKGISHEIR